jgi:serine/threonine-protein kinase
MSSKIALANYGISGLISVTRGLTLIGGIVIYASSVSAESWRSYHNDRFGTTADVPAGWKMEPPPANDDGRIFTSPDGRAELVVNGMFANVADPDELGSRLEPLEGETITYKQRKGNWVVVSGVKGDKIFYRKTLLSCRNTVANNLSIEYPAAEKEAYDALVAHVGASLKSGNGYDVETKCK